MSTIRDTAMVHIYPPDVAALRLPLDVAAAYVVRRFGKSAEETEVIGRRSLLPAYWSEVDRLLAGGEPSEEAQARVRHLLLAQGLVDDRDDLAEILA
jgi:hypothetical protein